MHERIRLNFVRLNKMYKIFQNYPWSTVNWNSASHELYRMHLIIWRVRSTNDKMIQVVAKKNVVVFFFNKSWLINKLVLFLQPEHNNFRGFFCLRNIFHPISSIDSDLKSYILLPMFFLKSHLTPLIHLSLYNPLSSGVAYVIPPIQPIYPTEYICRD